MNISFGESTTKHKDAKRRSVIYETLVIKLREEAKNPTLHETIKEESESSLKSDSSIEPENSDRLNLPFN